MIAVVADLAAMAAGEDKAAAVRTVDKVVAEGKAARAEVATTGVSPSVVKEIADSLTVAMATAEEDASFANVPPSSMPPRDSSAV